MQAVKGVNMSSYGFDISTLSSGNVREGGSHPITALIVFGEARKSQCQKHEKTHAVFHFRQLDVTGCHLRSTTCKKIKRKG